MNDKVLVEIKTENGESLILETATDNNLSQYVSASGKLTEATASFEKALKPAMEMIRGVVAQINTMPDPKPNAVELSFGLKISGKLDVFAVSVSGEGNINLKLNWSLK